MSGSTAQPLKRVPGSYEAQEAREMLDSTAEHSESVVRSDKPFVDLSTFDNSDYNPGRGLFVRTAWYFLSLLIFESGWFPVSRIKTSLLRWFGACIGEGVVIKPHVRIKYPWRLTIGNHCWIGQDVWIDNIENVKIGSHVCVSQLVYFCTGSHDHRKQSFDLIAKPIEIGSGVWLGARAMLLGGVSIGANAIVAAGSVVNRAVGDNEFVGGVPAKVIGQRDSAPTQATH